jgi:hypothetical protein
LVADFVKKLTILDIGAKATSRELVGLDTKIQEFATCVGDRGPEVAIIAFMSA